MAIRMKSSVTLTANAKCPSHSKSDISVRDLSFVIDEPIERGGTNLGPTPTDTALAALIGCTNVIGHKCASKLGVDIGHLNIEVSCEFDRRGVTLQDEIEVPFTSIKLEVIADGSASEQELAQVASETEKFCPLSKLFIAAGHATERHLAKGRVTRKKGRTLMSITWKGRILGAALITALAAPAFAAETIKAVVIDGYPARALWVKEFTEFFIPEVDKRLAESGNYKMDWQESYGGSIVKPKGVLEGVKLGLGDIGIVTTIFHSSKLPTQAISAVTPFVAADSRAVAKAVDEIAREYPTMQNEFAAQNQVYLATGVVLDTYQMFSTSEVSSLSDMEGKKIAGAGMNLRYLEGIDGAAGVRGGLTDFYNMLQTGLVEGAMLWPEAAKTFKIAEVAPYMLRVDLGAVNSKTITVNKDYWDSLPDEVKGVLQEVAILYRDHVAGIAMDRAQASRDAYVESGGTIVDVSIEDRTAWANAMPNIAAEWAAGLNDSGEPGTEMLNAYLGKAGRSWIQPGPRLGR